MKRFIARHRGSFRWQLALGVALVHAVLMTLFVAELVRDQQRFLHDRHVQRSMSLTQGVAQQALNDLLSSDLAAAQEIVQGLASYPELHYVAILDVRGRVLAHTERSRVGSFMVDAETARMLAGPVAGSLLVDDGHVMDVAVPVQWRGEAIGWVRFASGMEGVNAQLRKVTLDGIGFAVVAVILGVALAAWMARGTTRRLYGLMAVADATRRGDRSARAASDERSEVGRLAGSFNDMLDALATQERELRAANEALESRIVQRTAALAESEEALKAILEQADDAFVSVSEDGDVVHWNRAAHQTFGWSAPEAVGRPLASLVMPPETRGALPGWMQRYLAEGGSALREDRRMEMTAWRRDGATFPVEVSVRVRRRADGARFLDAFLRDISERKSMEGRLKALALEDSLTQLPNRRSVLQHLPAAQARAARSRRAMGLLYLDLDGFKGVNDRLGHPAGDEVLRTFARRLTGIVRASDVVARMGGDEFVVILEGLACPEDALRVAEKAIAVGSEPYLLDGAVAELSCSVGIRIVRVGEDTDPGDLLSQADEALYESKRAGKKRWRQWATAARDEEATGRT